TDPEMPQASRARRPWVAVVLTLLTPGLGHLYAGAPRRALGFWLLSLTVGTAIVATLSVVAILSIVPGPLLLVGGVLGTVLTLGWVAWSAARTARNAAIDFVPRGFNRWYVYLAIMLTTALVVQPAYLKFLNSTLLQAYQIPVPAWSRRSWRVISSWRSRFAGLRSEGRSSSTDAGVSHT